MTTRQTEGTETDPGRSEDVRRAVRDRYAAAATADTGCCAPSSCGCGDAAELSSEDLGYSSDDLASLPEGADLGLGCGNPTGLASLVAGEVVLDLGSGGGIDCFLASEKVGPDGQVIGVDMTPEMIARARANARGGGYTNVDFRLGEIEALPVADASVDAILSNCVLNLSPERSQVLHEARRVLKPGGRMIISDLISDVEAPASLQENLDALSACLPVERDAYLGAFREAGFDVKIVEERGFPVETLLQNDQVQQVLGTLPHEELAQLRAFGASIRSAVFEARPIEDA